MDNITSLAIMFLPLILVFFFMTRSDKKKKTQYQEMLAAVQINDEVTTKSGVIGKVIKIEDDTFIIQSGPDRTRFKMLKESIAYITRGEDGSVLKNDEK